MKKIEIPTAQNIKIEYQLGGIFERGIAFVIDAVIMGFAYSLISMFSALVSNGGEGFLLYILGAPILLFYHLGFEVFNHGQTPGKRLMGLRVMKTDGKLSDFKSYLIRYVFRLVDITFTFFSVGILMIVSSVKNQRLGDKLADTCVVKVKGTRRFNIKGVISATENDHSKKQFEHISKLTEEEMLLVQEVLQRQKKYANSGHARVVDDTTNKVAEVLGVEQPTRKVEFLDRVLKEYVQSTR